MSGWIGIAIMVFLVIDTFFVSYAVGLNLRRVKVVDYSLSPPAVATAEPSAATSSTAPAGSTSSQATTAGASMPVSSPSTAKSFTDLTQTESRLQSSLVKAAAAGILDPTQDQRFRPNDPVTRADFTRWMVRIRQIPPDSPQSPTYSDVDASNPYFADIEGATKAMMVQGYTVKGNPQKAFKPDQNITRQEFAVMYGTFSGKRGRAETLSKEDIEKYLRYNPAASEYQQLTYKDVGDVDDWARKWVAVAHQAGVLLQAFDVNPYASSEDKQYFHPQQMMTRAEAVNILVKLYGTQSMNAVREERPSGQAP